MQQQPFRVAYAGPADGVVEVRLGGVLAFADASALWT